jgi:hypothetical protein
VVCQLESLQLQIVQQLVICQFEGSNGVRLGWFLDSLEGTNRPSFLSCFMQFAYVVWEISTENQRGQNLPFLSLLLYLLLVTMVNVDDAKCVA